MTRDEAKKLLNEIPEFIPGPCSDCGATTIEEAAGKCRQMQLPCGDWVCATPDDPQPDSGPLLQRNPEYDHIDGYLWGWLAFDDGMTKTPPTWTPFKTEHPTGRKRQQMDKAQRTHLHRMMVALRKNRTGELLHHQTRWIETTLEMLDLSRSELADLIENRLSAVSQRDHDGG